MSAFALSFVVIFIAEFGDKSQLMALAFAARHGLRTVLGAITLATAGVHLLSVAIGVFLGAALPRGPIGILAGLAFIAFGAWTLHGDELDEEERGRARRRGSAFWFVAGSFLLAELGDKTMFATITLAANDGWFGTWLGSTLGMVAADGVAIAAGAAVSRVLSPVVIQRVAATLFFAFGVWLCIEGVRAFG